MLTMGSACTGIVLARLGLRTTAVEIPLGLRRCLSSDSSGNSSANNSGKTGIDNQGGSAAKPTNPPPPGSPVQQAGASSPPSPPPPAASGKVTTAGNVTAAGSSGARAPGPPSPAGTPPPGFKAPVEHPGSKSRFKLLGWIIPLLGVPAMAVLYFNEMHKTDETMARIMGRGTGGKAPGTTGSSSKPAGTPAAPRAPESAPAAADEVRGQLPGEAAYAAAVGPAAAAAAPAAADVPPSEVAADKILTVVSDEQQQERQELASSALAATAAATAADEQQQQQQQQPGTAQQQAEDVPGVQQHQQAQEAPAVHEQQQQQQQEQQQRESDSAAAGSLAAAVAAHAAAGQYTPVPGGVGQLEAGHVAPGTMGMSVDLSPAGLIHFAIEQGAGPGEDWEAFRSRHRQAASDAELFRRALQEALAYHEEQLAQANKAVQDAEGKAEEVRRMAVENAERFRSLLRQHQQMAAELRDIEVRQAEKRVMLKFSDAWLAERKQRIGALDEVRMHLGALAQAHEARAAQQALAHESHALALGLLGLTAALEAGKPVGPHAAALKSAGQDDALVEVAVAALPSSGASQGIPTRSELESEFRRTRSVLSELAYFPGRSAGMLAHAAARLANALKLDESTTVRTLGEHNAGTAASAGGVGARLAVAEAALSSGDLRMAAEVVEAAVQGTAAEAAAQAWVQAVKGRAAADQSLQLLRAHARVLAASLA